MRFTALADIFALRAATAHWRSTGEPSTACGDDRLVALSTSVNNRPSILAATVLTQRVVESRSSGTGTTPSSSRFAAARMIPASTPFRTMYCPIHTAIAIGRATPSTSQATSATRASAVPAALSVVSSSTNRHNAPRHVCHADTWPGRRRRTQDLLRTA
jgi:hypothetical protein